MFSAVRTHLRIGPPAGLMRWCAGLDLIAIYDLYTDVREVRPMTRG